MTSELRTMIELKDIKGIEMKCPECGSSIYQPITRAENVEILCPSCHRQWFGGTVDMNNRTIGSEQLKSLARVLNLMTSERADIMVKISLHVKTVAES